MGLPLFATSTNSMGLYVGNHRLHSNAHTARSHTIYKLSISGHWRELDPAGAAIYYMKSIYNYTLRNEKRLQKSIDKLDRNANAR
jgi:hypothetical protein